MTHLLARFLSHAHIACVRGRTHIQAQAQKMYQQLKASSPLAFWPQLTN